MPRKLRELRSELRRAGFRIGRLTGSHQVWEHPKLEGVGAVLAGNVGADAKPYFERQVREALRRLREALDEEDP